ncbi:protein-L-isoaspartate(D-aspartate) O-methyltransferase [Thiomicrospira sp. WB1]|uniref:protein-L-isoaspartate(D-aspartate) O-methyltransferase n=1 Tax=Thiomicrospira sp. WB1 TaxID=1685380 RepID=UPI000746DF8D|nr:protein-L-isoaspartate(D-aspartate) O-methyltransferase [Thiomicrospira sp. WB1]KUJ72079.1 protein-L-isoaspartate O-methyltransferase [Thiomicrospira sp. WB1]
MKLTYPNDQFERLQGVGMTSQRTRDRLIDRLEQTLSLHPSVAYAMRVTPRHLFMDEAMASRAYEDSALPIGHAQTISQPQVVAIMLDFILRERTEPLHGVMEIGTGSGYQAALLGLLAEQVWTLERIKPLYLRAKQAIAQLDLDNVHVKLADGFEGLPDQAPFDAILSAAAPETLPERLLDQVAINGRLVAPVGGETQTLQGWTRTPSGWVETDLGAVRFVPMLTGVDSTSHD